MHFHEALLQAALNAAIDHRRDAGRRAASMARTIVIPQRAAPRRKGLAASGVAARRVRRTRRDFAARAARAARAGSARSMAQRYRAAAQANQIRLIPVAAPRGMIRDRHGMVIARSRPSFRGRRSFHRKLPTPIASLQRLASVLGVSDAQRLWYRLLHHRGVNYPNFRAGCRQRTLRPGHARDRSPGRRPSRGSPRCSPIFRASISRCSRFATTRTGRPARISSATSARSRKTSSSGSSSEGYSPNDVIGKDGLEFTYDTYSARSARRPARRRRRDRRSRSERKARRPKPPVPGDTLVTNDRLAVAAHRRGSARRRHSRRLGTRPQLVRRGRRRGSLDRRHPGARELSELRSQRLRGRSLEAR